MKNKSKKIGYLLALFLGGIGAHAFYYGKYIRGSLYLLFCWTYVPIFLGLIDMFFIEKWTQSSTDRLPVSKRDTLPTGHSTIYNHELPGNKTELTISKKELPARKKEEPVEKKTELKPNKNLFSSSHFYDEKAIILPKYEHLQTPKEILNALDAIKNSKKDSYSRNGISIEFTISHSGSEFIKDSLKYAKEKGVESPEIPLQAYWTTYEDLNANQKKWYFYWRQQVLNGQYPEVDLSYIFLFVYELLNYSFNSKASFNVSMLVRLHENYIERLTKLKNYLPQWIADMLFELKESDLANEWNKEKTFSPALYTVLEEKEKDLSRISITTWKPYIRNYRETTFFQSNKNKVYKTFKESVPLLQQLYKEQGIELKEHWFHMKEERVIRNLFSSAVVGRPRDAIHVYVTKIEETEALANEVSNLFRLSENVTRRVNGEKREIKVDEEFLPEGLKDMMMERFRQAAKETNKRFKTVQKLEVLEEGGEIPAPPEGFFDSKDKPVSDVPVTDHDNQHQEPGEEVAAAGTVLPQKKPKIQFDMSRIKKLQGDTDHLIDTINVRSEIDIETESEQEEQKTDESSKDNSFEPEPVAPATPTPAPQSKDIFSALGGGSETEEGEFLEALTEVEKEFLSRFKNGEYNQQEANQFLKQKGIMMGMFLSELNEKANEYLGDNLLETQSDMLVLYEEYEHLILLRK